MSIIKTGNVSNRPFWYVFGPLAISVHAYTWEDYTWYERNGHYYALTNDWGTWEDAEPEAVSLGGHLATIDDSAENDWLTTTFADTNPVGQDADLWNFAWIGYYQDGTEWKWSSGSAVVYTKYYKYWNNYTGTHAYLHVEGHPDEGDWCRNPDHDVTYDPQQATGMAPKGIIELDYDPANPVPLPPSLVFLVTGLFSISGFRRYKAWRS